MAETIVKEVHIGAAFRSALSSFARHAVPLLVIALPGALIGLASLLAAWRGAVLLSLVMSIVSSVIGWITEAALIYAVFQLSTGRPLSPVSSYQRVFDRLGPLIAYTLRYGGAVLLLCITVVGIPWGIRVAIRWWFGRQAIILTDESPKEAISRSCRLVSGVWWRIFLAFLTVALLTLPNLLLGFIWPRGLTAGLIGSAISFLIAPITPAFWTAIYLQLDEQERAILASQPAAP